MVSNSKMFWKNRDAQADSRIFLESSGESYTFSDVFGFADEVYNGTSGGVVLLLCDKNIETIVGYVGALRNNLVPMLLDANIKNEALQRNITAYKPRYIYAANGRPDLLGYSPCREFGNHSLYQSTLDASYSIHDELKLLIPTSGSTGDPKCVRLSGNNIISCTTSVCEYLKMEVERCSISLLPIHYSFGLSVLHNALNSRSRYVLTKLSVIDREFWKIMEDERVTDFSAVPFIYETLRRINIPPSVMNNLVCATQAGGRLQPKFTQFFAELFAANEVDYFTMYGQTEASPRISYLPPEFALEKLGSVGVPISCGKAFIAETQERVGEGELLYRGPNVCLGYANSHQQLALGNEQNGELRTGDQVSIDNEGFIYIVGRRKRFVKVQGISVNLDHLEGILKSKNIECSVVGTENKVVVCYKDFQKEGLESIMKENFNFHPSTLKYVEMEAIPLNSSGKPDYKVLSETYL